MDPAQIWKIESIDQDHGLLTRPIFNGNESNFEIFEIKFLSYLRLCGLYNVTQDTDSENDDELNA